MFHYKLSLNTSRSLYGHLRRRINRNTFVVVCLLGDSPASEFYVPTFRSTVSFHLHGLCRQEIFLPTQPMHYIKTNIQF